jgi:uncharacterized protein YpiB (UPF0302 family)
MKKVKIANGVRRIEDSDPNATLFRLRDVLSEHRSVLITRIVSDLATYIDYKFQTKASAKQLESIRDQLQTMRNSALDLDRYSDIIDHFYAHEMTHIRTEPFLKEIDECIDSVINVSQLKLVN